MKGKGFSPTHVILWRCCEAMEVEAERKRVGALHFHLSEMLFSLLAYEAYLNFVMCFMVPEAYKSEQKMDIKEKLKAIEEKVGLIVDRLKDPYATVAWHEQFRDFLVHGKPEEYALTLAVVKANPEFPFNSKLEQWVSKEKAHSLKSMVFELCCEIHHFVLKKADHRLHRKLGDGPFSAVEEVWVEG